MFYIVLGIAASATPAYLSTCQASNVFDLFSFELTHLNESGLSVLSLSFTANLTSVVEHPYLEVQLLEKHNHIPAHRYKYPLCGSRRLKCPARQDSQLRFADHMPLVEPLGSDAHALKLIFREGKTKLACYSVSLS